MDPRGVAAIAAIFGTLLVLSSRVTETAARPSEGNTSSLAGLLLGTVESCVSDKEDAWSCMEQKAGQLAERALRVRSIPVMEGVSLEKTSRGDGRSIDNRSPLTRVLESFSLQVKPPAFLTDPVLFREVLEEGRGKAKKYLLPLLLVFSTIKAYLFIAAVTALAAVAGKALLVGKLALILALTAAYKNYFSQKKQTTIEVVKVPQVTHSQKSHYHHSSHHGGNEVHHEKEHSSSHEWENSHGNEEGSYSHGGEYEYYDKRRSDKGLGVAAASDLAYRGYGKEGNVMWSRRDDGIDWRGEEEGGREERSAPWRAMTERRPISTYANSDSTWT